jgi:hypothetical protein
MYSQARFPTATGASPGGSSRHFWLAPATTSAPASSISTTTPPIPETASTSTSASNSFAISPMGGSGLTMAVELSLWVT